jgi:predicted ATP-dependent serine protease
MMACVIYECDDCCYAAAEHPGRCPQCGGYKFLREFDEQGDHDPEPDEIDSEAFARNPEAFLP